MDSTEEVTSITGYLHRRSRKKYLPFWRRLYCVLNGRLLLFYKTEEHYRQLQACRDVLDLGLVYEIKQALGVDRGIVISTHRGPCWLRARSQSEFDKWYEAVQAAVVMRNPKETLTRLAQPSVIQERQSVCISPIETTVPQRDNFRLSLDVIADAKYSTYDGGRNPRLYGSDTGLPFQEKSDTIPAEDVACQAQEEQGQEQRETVKRRKMFSSIRPISGSVSNFLQMAIQAHFHPSDESRNRSKTVTGTTGTIPRSKSPRLPTSPTLEKIISNTDPNDINSTLMETEKNRKSRKQVEFAHDLENQQIHPEPNQDSCQDIHSTEMECQLKKETEIDATITAESPQEPSGEVTVRARTDKCPDEETPCKDSKKKEKGKEERKSKRRKSSLAFIKEFFFPSKSKQKTEPSNPEQKENLDQDPGNASNGASASTDNCVPNQQEKPEPLQMCETDQSAVEKEQNQSGLEEQVNQHDNEQNAGCDLTTDKDSGRNRVDECKQEDDIHQQSADKRLLSQISEERDPVIEPPCIAVVAPVYESNDDDSKEGESDGLFNEMANEILMEVKINQQENMKESSGEVTFLEIIEPSVDNTATECQTSSESQADSIYSSFEQAQKEKLQIVDDNEQSQHQFLELNESFPSDSESLNKWKSYWKSDEIPLLRESIGSTETVQQNAKYLSFQEEKRPPLPIKTRTRSASPPYDIPRAISIPVHQVNVQQHPKGDVLETEMAAILSEDIRVNDTADVTDDNDFVLVSNIPEGENSPDEQLESSTQISETIQSVTDLSKEPQMVQNAANEQEVVATSPSCVSTLISKFENPNQITVPKRRSTKSKSEHRLSYAATETEIVEEEVVKELFV